MIKQAIILAAGCGSRLRPTLSDDLPKGAIEIENKAIIEQSINKLIDTGIEEIFIGTGHGASWYDDLATRYSQITCVKNDDFDQSGSMHTLSLLIPCMSKDALLLESDLLYETRCLQSVIDSPDPNVILATPLYNYGDEVFISTTPNNQLKTMSKNPPHNQTNPKVLSGISKCSYKLLQTLQTLYIKKQNKNVDYEDILVEAGQNTPIYILYNKAIHAMEIDTHDHYEIAKRLFPSIKHNDAIKHHERTILLNPGPATLSNNVKYAQIVPDICPRETEFNQVVSDVKSMISTIASKQSSDIDVTLFSGSGTASVESIISSVISDNDHLLVINQGAYGQRMLDIARIYNLNVTEFKPDPLAAIPIEDLEDIIKKKTITHLALIHHETSTGLLNDLSPIASLVKKHKLVCCVDAMSSFGAVSLDMHTDAIDFCAASSNKNIQGTAGLSFVISKKSSLAAIQSNTKRTLYLDLASQTHYSNTYKQFQFTPPVQTLYALREALLDLYREGISNRYKRYQLLWTQLHNCFSSLGFKHIVDTSTHGKLITAYVIDKTMTFSFDHFHDFLYRNHITIYPGKMGTVSTFRIANIGALSLSDITDVCDIIKHYFKTFPLFK